MIAMIDSGTWTGSHRRHHHEQISIPWSIIARSYWHAIFWSGCNARTFMQNSQRTGQWMMCYLPRHLPYYLRTKLLVFARLSPRCCSITVTPTAWPTDSEAKFTHSVIFAVAICVLRYLQVLHVPQALWRLGPGCAIYHSWIDLGERMMIAFAPQELPCQEHLCRSAGLAAPGLLGSVWWWWGEVVVRRAGECGH